MKALIIFSLLCLSFSTFAAKSKKVNYEYKKFEKFDFSAIDVEGGGASPGDLSISPRFRKKFRNKIPERKAFHREMKRALDTVR